jgi:hypothetical protein
MGIKTYCTDFYGSPTLFTLQEAQNQIVCFNNSASYSCFGCISQKPSSFLWIIENLE